MKPHAKSVSSTRTTCFRILFALALAAVTHFTTTAQMYPGTELINDKLAHAASFLILAFLADYSFPKVEYGLTKTAGLLAYGLGIEITQYFIPGRSFSFLDMAADGLGLAVYGVLVPFIRQQPAPRSGE